MFEGTLTFAVLPSIVETIATLILDGGAATGSSDALSSSPDSSESSSAVEPPDLLRSTTTGIAKAAKPAKNKNGSGSSGPTGSVSKADMEKLIERASQTAPAQTIRIEQAPIKIAGQNDGEPPVKPTI